jgi:hypothetical protein
MNLAYLAGSVKGPGYERIDGGPTAREAVSTIEHVHIKRMKIVLQTDIMPIEMYLGLSKLRYAILRRRKQIMNVYCAWRCLDLLHCNRLSPQLIGLSKLTSNMWEFFASGC